MNYQRECVRTEEIYGKREMPNEELQLLCVQRLPVEEKNQQKDLQVVFADQHSATFVDGLVSRSTNHHRPQTIGGVYF